MSIKTKTFRWFLYDNTEKSHIGSFDNSLGELSTSDNTSHHSIYPCQLILIKLLSRIRKLTIGVV